MIPTTERPTGHFRYGGTEYWTPRKNVGGTAARRLMEMVELHFHEDGSPLILDLRLVPIVDSEGAYYLEAARRRHPGLQVVGRPRDFATLPRSIRNTLDIIRPSESLENALSFRSRTTPGRSWSEKRRHNRIPVHIPVEIFCGGRSAVATLRDISLGGGRLGKVSSRLVRELERTSPSPELTIAGIDQDPLGLEIVKPHNSSEIVTRPVYFLSGNSGMGIQFAPAPADSGRPPST